MMRVPVIAAGLACIMVLAAFAGCTSSTATPSYSVDNNGVLSVTCAPVTTNETVLFSNVTYTESKIVLHTQTGDVVTYLSTPAHPKAVMLYLPGAGEKISGHAERMVTYAKAGYAFMFLDYRGRGGETAGYPLNPQTDYALFENKEWPEYYLTICDISSARAMLTAKFGVPVYAVGGSNGGRYAAVAAGVDKNFAGYVGISTSDWGIRDSVAAQGGTGDILRFATSLEPSTYLPTISPRPVWMFHNATDPVIPFTQGKALFATANEPKTFTEFNGDHGINPDVDARLIALWAQIYGTQT
jgi:hypothetical protein